MQYKDILSKIETDVKNDKSTDLFRYHGLLEAIRFFSNRLSVQQITDAAFDFVNELLTVEKSALYLLNDGKYELTKLRGMDKFESHLPVSTELSEFVLYVGNVIWGRTSLESFIDASVLDKLDATVMIPLPSENQLYGFFLLSRRISAHFNDSDILVCETLMNLIKNALENCIRLEQLQVSNGELDEKIFNLFAINQSAKAMLTEHKLDELYNLAVDVFSELTQSANTGFVLYVESSEKYELKAYRDVFNTSTGNTGIDLSYNLTNRFIRGILDLSVEDDITFFKSLFDGANNLIEDLKAKYIVFIFGENQKILGFVTLGETVTGYDYKKSSFELIDSLASYTFIALSNALHIGKVNEQKMLLQEKLHRMITLNQLSKNINSAIDSDSLIELTLKTLSISFGVENALIALYDSNDSSFHIHNSTDPTLAGTIFPMTPAMEPLTRGSKVFEADSDNLAFVIGDTLNEKVSDAGGVLIIPITLERYDIILVGAIFIFKVQSGNLSDEENTLIFDTIANHMAPLVEGFKDLEIKQSLLQQDMAKLFVLDLETQIKECENYDLDLQVIRIMDHDANPYKRSDIPNILNDEVGGIYPVSFAQTEVLITNNFESSYSALSQAIEGMNLTVSRYHYKKDFLDLKSFCQL